MREVLKFVQQKDPEGLHAVYFRQDFTRDIGKDNELIFLIKVNKNKEGKGTITIKYQPPEPIEENALSKWTKLKDFCRNGGTFVSTTPNRAFFYLDAKTPEAVEDPTVFSDGE